MKINSTSYPLPMDNVDTDQIIPARFLKQVDKKGLSKGLFYNWRFDSADADQFPLNDKLRQGSEILIAGNNFGCGSSREHAAWALSDFGIKAVVSSQFADIFKTNAFYSGIILITLSEIQMQDIMKFSEENPQGKLTVDLEKQEIVINDSGRVFDFEMDEFKKECLVKGISETEYLINLKPVIEEYELKMS